MPRKAMRDVIVLLPGITGSVLQKHGKDVWAISSGSALNALLTLGDDIRELALTEDPPDVDDLGDGVTAPRVIHDIHLIPGLWKIDGYTKVASRIKATFDVTPGENFFEFPYDWRRDNRVAARKLDRDGRAWLNAWRQRSGSDEAKLILVGHSMGGIVSRYFLECMDGWRDTRLLVTFGTPYRGSLNALGFLANGFEKKLGPFTVDLSGLLRSLTSVYQLLPIYPCYDDGGGQLARVNEATIRNVDSSRAASALAFHKEIADAVEEHERDDAYRQGRYAIRPVVGTTQPTAQSARFLNGKVELLRSYEDKDLGGDGTVPRVSATPLELDDEANAMFAAERHASLQNADPVLVQLASVMSGLDINFAAFRGAVPTVGLSLDLDDTYAVGEPAAYGVEPADVLAEPLTAIVEDVDKESEVARQVLRPEAGRYSGEFEALPSGIYRLTVVGSGAVEPVSDLFAVLREG
jgi:pimeloyl-ACP methyl ester carboxylesterase